MESSNGVSLFVTSNGSLESYPGNTSSCFTNTLKSPISLNHSINYEVQLSNLHIPAYENILKGNDYEYSYIAYNIGQFVYDPYTRKYKLQEELNKELFRLAPNKDFEGLFDSEDTLKNLYQIIPNDNSLRDLMGNPSLKIQKENLINRISKSLRLDSKSKTFRKDLKLLYHLKRYLHLAEHNANKFDGDNNLMANWYSQFNGLLFADLKHVPQEKMYDLMLYMMSNVNFPPNKFTYLLKSSSQYMEALPYPRAEGTSILSDVKAERFVNHIKRLAKKCDGLSLYIGAYSDDVIKTFIRSGILQKGSGLLKKCEDNINVDEVADIDITTPSDENGTNAITNKRKLIKVPSIENPENNDVQPNAPLLGIYVTFGRKMAKFLAIEENQIILVGHYGFPTSETPQNYFLKITPDFHKTKVNTIMVYSDIVKPSIRVAGLQTNILDIISVPNTGTIQRTMAQAQFRPLRNHEITDITIEMYNRDGDSIHYAKDSYSALELKIRPVKDSD